VSNTTTDKKPILTAWKYCEWVKCPSSQRAASDHYFSLYYKTISAPLRKFLQNRLKAAEMGDAKTQAEDLMNEMFRRVLSRQQEVNEYLDRLHELTENLSLEAKGEPYDRRVNRWRLTARGWCTEVRQFCVRTCPEATEEACESQANDINQRCGLVQAEGGDLALECLDSAFQDPTQPARSDLAAVTEEEIALVESDEELPTQAEPLAPNRLQQAKQRLTRIRNLLKQQDTTTTLDQQLRLPGAATFLVKVDNILTSLSALRIPLLPLYYQIARNLITDQGRRFTRQNEMSLEGEVDFDEDSEEVSRMEKYLADHSDERKRQKWAFKRDVDQLLTDRLLQAKTVLMNSMGATERRRAQTKFEKEQDLFAQYRTLVALIMEGFCTQEQLAERLGLSRDQIRYRLESMSKILQPLRGEMK